MPARSSTAMPRPANIVATSRSTSPELSAPVEERLTAVPTADVEGKMLLSRPTRKARQKPIPRSCDAFDVRHADRAGRSRSPFHIQAALPLMHLQTLPTIGGNYNILGRTWGIGVSPKGLFGAAVQ